MSDAEWERLEAQHTVRTDHVSSGELRFLATPPTKPVHEHHNTITLLPGSLRDGWVRLNQCHATLDRVPRTQIVFRPERSRALRILSQAGIGRAWVQDASVQLEAVGDRAHLCLETETRALDITPDGYVLRNGPFMRRFLDGYYPMRVTVTLLYPPGLLRPQALHPAPQPGLTVREQPGLFHFDAWFEGALRTEIRLRPAA